MAYFPMCVNLEGASVVLIGEGPPALEKLNLLLPFGASIQLFSLGGFAEWENHPGVLLRRRALTAEDLEPRPAFVVAADAPPGEKERVSALCQSLGVPVNVADEPELCTFYFPSLTTRGALTVAVSTGGKSPGAAAYLRRHLEKYIPDQTEAILDWAYALRQRLRAEYPQADRRSILRQAVARAFAQNSPLTEEELRDILRPLKSPDAGGPGRKGEEGRGL